jgi:hypothetical protein
MVIGASGLAAIPGAAHFHTGHVTSSVQHSTASIGNHITTALSLL